MNVDDSGEAALRPLAESTKCLFLLHGWASCVCNTTDAQTQDVKGQLRNVCSLLVPTNRTVAVACTWPHLMQDPLCAFRHPALICITLGIWLPYAYTSLDATHCAIVQYDCPIPMPKKPAGLVPPVRSQEPLRLNFAGARHEKAMCQGSQVLFLQHLQGMCCI